MKLSVGLIVAGLVTPSRVNSIGWKGFTKSFVKRFDITANLFWVTVTLAALYDTREDG